MHASNCIQLAKAISKHASILQSALSTAGVSQVVVALRKIFHVGFFLDTEPKLSDVYHQMTNVVQIHLIDTEWHKPRCQWYCAAYDEYVARMHTTMQVETYWHEGTPAVPEALR